MSFSNGISKKILVSYRHSSFDRSVMLLQMILHEHRGSYLVATGAGKETDVI